MYKLYLGGAFVQGFKTRDEALAYVVEKNLISREFEILDASDE